MRYRYTFLVAGLFALISCENDVNIIPDLHNKRTAIEEGHDITAYMSEKGKVKAKLMAPLMYRYVSSDSSYVEFPHTLHVDFYNDSLKLESRLDAHYGKYRESENKVFLKDSVIIINLLKGDTLRCREMWWDQNTQKFYTDKPVHITQRDGTDLYGNHGMEAKQDLSERIIYGANGRGPVPKDIGDSTAGSPDSTKTVARDSTKPAK